MFYKFLTQEEKDHLKAIKEKYKLPEDQYKYEKDLEHYLNEIHYEDRLAEYLKDKWYIKLIKWIQSRRKK